MKIFSLKRPRSIPRLQKFLLKPFRSRTFLFRSKHLYLNHKATIYESYADFSTPLMRYTCFFLSVIFLETLLPIYAKIKS